MGTEQATSGSALLRAFLDANKLSLQDFADGVGVSKTAVIYWLRGEHVPRGITRDLVQKATGGQVPASSWMTDEERAALAGVQPFQPPTTPKEAA